MDSKTIKGRLIFSGNGAGKVLKSDAPLGLFGHLDPKTGIYHEAGHPLDGKCVKDRVLVFPRAKGSTVGSYVLYALRKSENAPVAMILSECDTIVAVGAIISSIPTVDNIGLSALKDGATARVKGGKIIVKPTSRRHRA
jgi:predicted aconitase with swiveling domain